MSFLKHCSFATEVTFGCESIMLDFLSKQNFSRPKPRRVGLCLKTSSKIEECLNSFESVINSQSFCYSEKVFCLSGNILKLLIQDALLSILFHPRLIKNPFFTKVTLIFDSGNCEHFLAVNLRQCSCHGNIFKIIKIHL